MKRNDVFPGRYDVQVSEVIDKLDNSKEKTNELTYILQRKLNDVEVYSKSQQLLRIKQENSKSLDTVFFLIVLLLVVITLFFVKILKGGKPVKKELATEIKWGKYLKNRKVGKYLQVKKLS